MCSRTLRQFGDIPECGSDCGEAVCSTEAYVCILARRGFVKEKPSTQENMTPDSVCAAPHRRWGLLLAAASNLLSLYSAAPFTASRRFEKVYRWMQNYSGETAYQSEWI